MICITGDVHHMSLKTPDQSRSDLSEAETARIYAEMAKEAGVRITLYLTGRLVDEEWPALRDWIVKDHIEIAGHTYNAFEPSILHRIWKKLTGNYNGPAWYERRDIRRTISVIREKTGLRIKSWRNHAYFHGRNTDRLLFNEKIRNCSDIVARPGVGPYLHASGLIHTPINIIPDHEHIYHGARTPGQVERWVRRYNWSDAYGSASYPVERWADMVMEQIAINESLKVTSVLLLHPLCMYLCDGFESFKRILEKAAVTGSVFMRETGPVSRSERRAA